MKIENIETGTRVVYSPRHQAAERGTVRRVGANVVHVLFDGDKHTKGCDPMTLKPSHAAAVACKGWRWMLGMRAVSLDEDPPCVVGHMYKSAGTVPSIEGLDDEGGIVSAREEDVVPDLDDPATLGCLLALVREAWGDPLAAVTPERGGGKWGCIVGRRLIIGATEAEALVAALEAAPARAGDRP